MRLVVLQRSFKDSFCKAFLVGGEDYEIQIFNVFYKKCKGDENMSKLVLIVGAQAVGKMTVGEALKEKKGFKMTINHDSRDVAAKIYGWGTPAYRELTEKIRKATFEVAIKNNIDLIFTYVWAFDLQGDWEFVEKLNQMFDGELYIVELITDLQTRLYRNDTEHRKAMKPTKRNVEHSTQNLLEDTKKYRLESKDGEVQYKNYMKIDNTNLSPEQVADMIIEKFNL